MRPSLFLALFLVAPLASQAQWQLQDAHTTADLRGIDSVGNGVAWASGTNGTVLRTEDSGFVWQLCATPPGAEHLDFRGIQAFDNNTAIIMSSGKGDLSRLYKTTDGCQTWKLLFTNPEKDGFWDALRMQNTKEGWLLGDPVDGRFIAAQTSDGGLTFPGMLRSARLSGNNESVPPDAGQHGAFAASNSALLTPPKPWTSLHLAAGGCEAPRIWFGTSGPGGTKLYGLYAELGQCSDSALEHWEVHDLPLNGSSSTSGVFSLATPDARRIVAVGGNYAQPQTATATAAYSADSGHTWTAAVTPPHGYRSAVAYDKAHNTWITVGPNGTDISTDDGRNWRSLNPGPSDAPDTDQHWNALSLPFVVGPHGRIATLRPDALPPKR